MKKLNKKQIAAFEKRQAKTMHGYGTAIVAFSFLAFVVAYAIHAVFNPECLIGFFKFLGVSSGTTAIYAVLAPMLSIDKVDPREAQGNAIKYKLYLLRQDEVDMDNYPTPDSVNMTIGSMALKAGKYWHYLECEENSIIPNAASEGEIAPSLKLTVTANLWGINKYIMNYLYNNNGAFFLLVWENCATGVKYIAGSPCSLMKMKVTRLGSDKDWSGASIEFTSTCPDPFLIYTGTTPTDTPETIAADATTIALAAGKSQYQLTDNTAAKEITAFTGMAAADHLRVVEILGSGGVHPSTITDDNDFILVGGETWSADAGAKLTVQIYKDGAATYKFIEVPGTRIS